MRDYDTASGLDVTRYSGLWYEIARLPLSFESSCVSATAYYTPMNNDTISVVNTCYSDTGDIFSINGTAFAPDPSEPRKLLVQFGEDAPLGSYNVLSTDYTSYAVVGSNNMSNWWLLSRKPNMTFDTYTQFVNQASDYGYNMTRLVTNVGTIIQDNPGAYTDGLCVIV